MQSTAVNSRGCWSGSQKEISCTLEMHKLWLGKSLSSWRLEHKHPRCLAVLLFPRVWTLQCPVGLCMRRLTLPSDLPASKYTSIFLFSDTPLLLFRRSFYCWNTEKLGARWHVHVLLCSFVILSVLWYNQPSDAQLNKYIIAARF